MVTPPQSKIKAVYRALDANCNRVREGLRVAEDTARFLLNDAALTARIKAVRHGVTRAEARLFKSPRLRAQVRDVAGDSGRGNREKSEGKRESVRSLVTANLKRAQEGLRSLEEFSKLIRHPASTDFKRLRYACYRIEEMASDKID
jgi:thiamine-phosphate pyrophosphorylase